MTLFWIIFLNFLISLISLIGIFTVTNKLSSSSKLTCIFISFSAGVMLSAAFLNMLSEAIHAGGEPILIYTLIGVLVGFMMERSVLWYHHHHEDNHNLHTSANLVLFGDSIHNFIDGVAIAATTVISPLAGITTAIGIAAHEIPQEFADFMILKNAGYSNKKALIFNFVSATFAIVGGIAGYYFINQINGLLPISLAITAGIFIYIAAADLIPELHEDSHKNSLAEQLIPFFSGIIIIFLLSKFSAH